MELDASPCQISRGPLWAQPASVTGGGSKGTGPSERRVWIAAGRARHGAYVIILLDIWTDKSGEFLRIRRQHNKTMFVRCLCPNGVSHRLIVMPNADMPSGSSVRI